MRNGSLRLPASSLLRASTPLRAEDFPWCVEVRCLHQELRLRAATTNASAVAKKSSGDGERCIRNPNYPCRRRPPAKARQGRASSVDDGKPRSSADYSLSAA